MRGIQSLSRQSTDLIRTVDPACVLHLELIAPEGDFSRIELFILYEV